MDHESKIKVDKRKVRSMQKSGISLPAADYEIIIFEQKMMVMPRFPESAVNSTTQGANINKSNDSLKIYSKLIECDIYYSISFNQVLDK